MSNDANPPNPPNHPPAANDSTGASTEHRDEAAPAITIQGERPTPADDELHKWFAAQQIKSLDNLEGGARQIIALCTTLLTVLLGLVALKGSAPPIYTERAYFQWFSMVGVVALFLALFCALMVVIPSTVSVAINDPDELQKAFENIFRHKSMGLNLAVICFVIAMLCITAMIVGALLVWYQWV